MSVEKENSLILRLTSLTVFGVAMGFLEAAVVVYLRDLYYPGGFAFPLKPMSLHAISTEYLREVATILMLFCLSIFGGRNNHERFSVFLYSFGIWDIFYYAWLKVLLNWPPSLWTWDILFLIPVVWVGPVLAPVICSITMIGMAWCIFHFSRKGYHMTIRAHQLILLVAGTVIIFVSFIWDFSEIIIRGGFAGKFWTLTSDPVFQRIVAEYIPATFKWPLFAAGELFILISLASFCRRN
jgi:hypothetical protein